MFASTPEPPYVAVIFSARRTLDDDAAYGDMAIEMERLAARQPGYLGIESARSRDRFGITVSYWATEADAQAWKQVGEHLGAQRLGRERWYERYVVRVATVGRTYEVVPDGSRNDESAGPAVAAGAADPDAADPGAAETSAAARRSSSSP